MSNNKHHIYVWDRLIRVFHWGLLLSVAVAYYTAKTDGAPFLFPIEVHAQAGYLILSLLIFRVLWGVLGTHYARFSTFLYAPNAMVTYAGALARRRQPSYASHNPLGGWMVILMLLSLCFQAVSGLFLSDHIFFQGPFHELVGRDLSRALSMLHALNSDVLLVLISLHVAALVMHKLMGEPLITAMLTGVKHFTTPPVDDCPHVTQHVRLKAALAVLIAAGIGSWLWFY